VTERSAVILSAAKEAMAHGTLRCAQGDTGSRGPRFPSSRSITLR
jgi:hypothetical protein